MNNQANSSPYLHKKYSLSELRRKLDRGSFCVTVEQEYGYRCWFWFPHMTEEQLIQKWQSAPAWGFTGWREYFGGRWMNEEDYPGARGSGPTPYRDFLELWYSRNNCHRYFVANLCCDKDSYLWSPNGRSYVHMGYEGPAKSAWHPDEYRLSRNIKSPILGIG